MPQPFDKVAPGLTSLSYSSNAIESVPDLASDICKIFSSWSYVEYQIDLLFLSLTGGSSRSALAVFASLESDRARLGAMRAAANVHLQSYELIAFEAALKMVRTAAKERNRFAHHLWGTIPGMPDAITLTPPDVAGQVWSVTKTAIYDIDSKRTPELESLEIPKDPKAHTMVYRASELPEIADRIGETAATLARLNLLIHARTNPPRYIPAHGPHPYPGTVAFAKRQLMSSRRFRQYRIQTRDSLRT